MSALPSHIFITDQPRQVLDEALKTLTPDVCICLVDENTQAHCLPQLAYDFDEIIAIKSGEINKTLETCQYIWTRLTEAGCSRKSLLVNLGGGVIGDMGGFCASTFKRGMRFINIPTTLLSQVDASIGGKLGVDFNGLKNHIGVFNQPERVIVSPLFLNTLDPRELKSGYAEMIKHALIYDHSHWGTLKKTSLQADDLKHLIPHSILIKNKVVESDPYENGLRKILNFGHTLGHAIESFYLTSSFPLLHGEAVAIGMILEAHLSLQMEMIDTTSFDEITQHILYAYPNLPDALPDLVDLQGTLAQDKKNVKGQVKYSLLSGIGTCAYDVQVDEVMVEETFKAYARLQLDK